MSAGWDELEDHRALDGDASTAEKARRLAAAEPLVRALCARRLGARGADDAAQAVLEQVWRAQQRQVFDSEEAVRRYAATVSRVMPGHDDRRSARAAPTGDVGELLWADESPGPAEQAERAEAVGDAAQRVSGLLDRLSSRERAVIEAVHFGEKSNAEVAEELGITPSGVRSAATRAMARMRDQVGAVSPNPLALDAATRRARTEATRWQRPGAEGFPRGAASAPVIAAARAFAAEQGRVPSRSELRGLTGTSGHTAAHVVRALRAEQGEPYEVTTPVRDRTEAAAREFLAEQGRAPTPGELRRIAETSDHTARAVLRGMAGPRTAAREELGQVEGAGPREGRWASPAFDRAEVAAREALAETGRMPNWREIAERADVGRSTAAEVRRALRAHQDQHGGQDQPVREDQRQDIRRTDVAQDDRQDSSDPMRAVPPEGDRDRLVIDGGAIAAAHDGELATGAGLGAPDGRARREAVDHAREAVARAADRAQHYPSGAGETAGEEGEHGRARQLALWSADDLGCARTTAVGTDDVVDD